jgi:RNA polymerase sigma-70 factor, ECF subfamily
MQEQIKNIAIDDHALVKHAKNGDTEAMSRLIIKYQDRIYNVILKICQNSSDAAELTQEAFVKVLEAINSFQGKSAFYTWLFRVAVNLTLNHCKRKMTFRTQSLDWPAGGDGQARQNLSAFLTGDKADDPVRLVQNKEIALLLEQAIGQLDEHHRAVVVLRDIEDMTYEQIAETLDLELGTVKSRLSRARENLRQILKGALL